LTENSFRIRIKIMVFVVTFLFILSGVAPIISGDVDTNSFDSENNYDFSSMSSDVYNYVIITTDILVDTVKYFKNWKELNGHLVKVVTNSWIYSNYNGSDNQERVRNFLIDNYQSWGIEYVLIVGNHNDIPMRYCFGPASNYNAIPTDFYYADLTGNWDSDRDGIYGEENDDSPDFNPELYVGRIPFNDTDIVKNICQKTINFEQNTESWKKKTLLLGAIINFENEVGLGNPLTDCAVLMEKLWDDVYSANGFSRTTMYEKDGIVPSDYDCDYPLTKENVIEQWSNGYGIVNWGSHGSSNGAYRRYWSEDKNFNNVPDIDEIVKSDSFILSYDAISLNDDKPSIVFSCACSNSDPDDPNNLGASLLENGAVAFIGATHDPFYYYGWEHENDGGSITMDYLFFEFFINLNQTCGEALYNSLFHYWNDDDLLPSYINMFTFCLYGDPSLSFDTFTGVSPPNMPIKPSGPELLTPYSEFTYSTISSDPEGHPLYYVWDWGDGSYSNSLGPFESGTSVEANHEWKTPGNFMVRVKTVGIIGYESSWSEPLLINVEGPVVEVGSITGGIKVNSAIKNLGNIEANNIEWSISFYGGSILLGRYTSGTITSIPAGGEVTIVSKFIYGIAFPTIIIVEAGIPTYSSDIEVQSADIIGFFIRIK